MKPLARKTSLDILELEHRGQHLKLHPHRAIYWEEAALLMVSDLHLGKVHHFRKSGIYLPGHAAMDNYERLSALLMEFDPRDLLILGDLFHSSYNGDWKNFSELRRTFSHISFRLVMGNHDILDHRILDDNEITCTSTYDRGPFTFAHYPDQVEPGSQAYLFAGHVHPGVRLFGHSRQTLKLPCFYFGQRQAILPAFGTFTGVSLVQPVAGDRVIVISEEQLVEVF